VGKDKCTDLSHSQQKKKGEWSGPATGRKFAVSLKGEILVFAIPKQAGKNGCNVPTLTRSSRKGGEEQEKGNHIVLASARLKG